MSDLQKVDLYTIAFMISTMIFLREDKTVLIAIWVFFGYMAISTSLKEVIRR